MTRSLCIPLALTLLLLGACTDTRRSSTEIENEFTLAVLTGIAATGEAVALAPVEFYSPQGVLLRTTHTDSAGAFASTVSRDSLTVQGLPVLVRVFGDSGDLYSLLTMESNDPSDTLFALVNPLTSLVARRLLGVALDQPQGGFAPPSPDSIRAQGQRAIAAILGESVQWDDFYSDRNFRPYAPLRPDQLPTSNDALLHTLGDEARRQGIPLDIFLDSLHNNPRVQYMMQQGFRFEVAANMVLLGVPPEEALRQMAQWGAGPLEVGEQEAYYQAMRLAQQQRQQQIQDSLQQGSGPHPLQGMAHRAVDAALQQIPLQFSGTSQLQTALGNLPFAGNLALEATLQSLAPVRTLAPEHPGLAGIQPFAAEVAHQAVRIIMAFPPETWHTENTEMPLIVLELVRDSVVGNFDIVALVNDTSGAYFRQNYAPWQGEDIAETVRIWRGRADAVPNLEAGNTEGQRAAEGAL